MITMIQAWELHKIPQHERIISFDEDKQVRILQQEEKTKKFTIINTHA